MTILQILQWVILVLGVVSIYTPWFQLARNERLTGSGLSKNYPEHGWIRWGFMALALAWCGFVLIIFFNLLLRGNGALFVGILFASIGLFIGSFAMITGVCPLLTEAIWLLYVVGDDARRAGRFQIAWSLIVIIVAGLMAVSIG